MRPAVLAAVLALALPCAAGAQSLVYVTNQDGASVAVVDTEARRVARTVDLRAFGASERARPHHVAVEPDGSAWYVSLIGDGRVLKLDAADRLVGEARFETPGLLALRPADSLLLVARSMTAVNPPPRVGLVRTGSMAVEEMDVLFPRPHALAFHPDGTAAYTASLALDQIAVLDLDAERTLLVDVPASAAAPALAHAEGEHAGHGPAAGRMLGHFAISPDGRWGALSGEMSGELLVFDLADPRAPRLHRSIPVGPRPWQPVFSPDGATLFLPVKGRDHVAVIRTADWRVEGVIAATGFHEPDGAAIAPDGRTLVVSGSNTRHAGGTEDGSVLLYDLPTARTVAVLPVGRNPTGVGAARPR